MSLRKANDENKTIPRLVPYELYYYFPNETEIFQDNKYLKTKYKRLIFEGNNNNFTDYEYTKLSKCEESFKLYQISLPGNWQASDTLRFLYANNFNIKKTIKAIGIYIKKYFQYTFILNPCAKLIEILNSGAFYINGRDSRFRPILHFSIAKLDTIKRNNGINDIINSVIYIFEYSLRYLLLPGQIESWIIMIDVCKSVSNIGDELKEVFKLLKSSYPCRLFKLFIVNVKGINYLTWSFVKLLIEQETLSKVVLIKDNERKSYFDFINPLQLEAKYGGLKENLIDKYFPPNYTKDKVHSYLLSFEKKLHILLTPNEYDIKMANESLFYTLPVNYRVNTNNINQSDNNSNRQSKT